MILFFLQLFAPFQSWEPLMRLLQAEMLIQMPSYIAISVVLHNGDSHSGFRNHYSESAVPAVLPDHCENQITEF